MGETRCIVLLQMESFNEHEGQHLTGLEGRVSDSFLQQVIDTHVAYDEESERIFQSTVIVKIKRLLDEGLSEGEILQIPGWQWELLTGWRGSFHEFSERVAERQITKEMPTYQQLELLQSDEVLAGRWYGNAAAFFLRAKKFLPDWMKQRDAAEYVKSLARFGVLDEMLPYLQEITEDDMKGVASYGEDFFFALFCSKLFGSKGGRRLSEVQAMYGNYCRKPVQWIQVTAPDLHFCFPSYDWHLAADMLLKVMPENEADRAKCIGYVNFSGGMAILQIGGLGTVFHWCQYPIVRYEGGGHPVAEGCRNVLRKNGFSDSYSDWELESRVIFLLQEIAGGNKDWVLALKDKKWSGYIEKYEPRVSLSELIARERNMR